MLNVLACSNALGTSIDTVLPAITSTIVTILQIIIPVILIVLGMVDFSKAVITSDEKEQKAAQGRFVKRVVYALIVFLLVAIVKLIFGVIGRQTGDSASMSSCIDCFINGKSCNADGDTVKQ